MSLRIALREAWRRIQPQLKALPRNPRLTSKAFLKPHDEWTHLQRVEALVDAEKKATESFFSSSREFQARIQAEEASFLPHEQILPEEQGPYMYFQRPNSKGFIEFGRHPRDQPNSEEILLDTETLARESGYADVPSCKVCDDHETLAYIVDTVGDDSFELGVCRLAANEQEIRVPGIRSVEFLDKDSVRGVISLLAVETDRLTKRANQLVQICIEGSEVRKVLLWEEKNDAAYLELFRTKDRKFILASSNTKSTSEVRVARCGQGKQTVDLRALLEPIQGVEYFAEHHENSFIVISNHERKDFAAYTLAEESLSSWTELQPLYSPPGDMHVTDADLLSDWLVLYGHEAVSPRISVLSLSEAKGYMVELPDIGQVEPGVNSEYNSNSIRFTFRSPVEPSCIYDLQLLTGKKEIVGRQQWDETLKQSMKCKRLEVPARDGTLIPLTLLSAGAQGPCLLHVYGGYGACLSPDFRVEHLTLVRRGWTVAWAHVRGGGERGWAWHQAGRELRKSRSILDLIDTIHYLLAHNIVVPGGLCLKGSSAGGLVLGSLLNSRDHAALVSAAILEVPFLDVLTAMSDPLLPLTAHEREEWGDPENPSHEMNIRSLSPYENLGSHPYPPMYVSCAEADARVPAWMARKYVARLRIRMKGFLSRRQGPTNSCFLHCADFGHAGAMDWDGRSQESARQIAFLHQALGLDMR